MELNRWLRERFKEPRQKWQEPQILVKGTEAIDGITYVQFNLNFFIDDMRLENGHRGDRISSQIYQEVVQYLKHNLAIKSLKGPEAMESEEVVNA